MEISNNFVEEEFNWADLGSFGSADAYLLPLTSIQGRCLCIEGRRFKRPSNAYKNNPFINANIEAVKTFISGQKEKIFL